MAAAVLLLLHCFATEGWGGHSRHHHRGGVVIELLSTASPLSSSPSLSSYASSSSPKLLSSEIDFSTLSVMDIVLFRRRPRIRQNQFSSHDTNKKNASIGSIISTGGLEIGAVQENRNILPLSTWTLDSAYISKTNDMMVFVVDEEHHHTNTNGLSSDDIVVLDVPSLNDGGSAVGFGSRQVGGGKGPGNPHGEEGELLYYIDRKIVEGEYRVVMNSNNNTSDIDEGEKNDNDDVQLMTIDVVLNPSLEHLW
jgi:hypothetical protein